MKRTISASGRRLPQVGDLHYKADRTELVEGSTRDSAWLELPHDVLAMWVYQQVQRYHLAAPGVLDWWSRHAFVHLDAGRGPSILRPDLAVYAVGALGEDMSRIGWEDMHPFIVCNIGIRTDDAGLYRRIERLQEYWILDPTPRSDQPTLTVHRRVGRRWEVLAIPFGETYTTPLLPGFSLVVDPRRR